MDREGFSHIMYNKIHGWVPLSKSPPSRIGPGQTIIQHGIRNVRYRDESYRVSCTSVVVVGELLFRSLHQGP